jgi:hypothetical protein
MTFNSKKIIGKKLNAKIKFYITKNLTIPIQISTTFNDKQFVFASFNEVKNELDYENVNVYLYEGVDEQIITFRVEYEDDSTHTIQVYISDFRLNCGVSYYLDKSIFKFINGVTFSIKLSFNRKYFYPDYLKKMKICVQNENNISKYLTFKFHIEEEISMGKSFFRGINNFFFGESVDERYCKVPHIGFNFTLNKYKIVESNEKMSDYAPKNDKELTVFYTPYKCILVNKLNTLFFLF